MYVLNQLLLVPVAPTAAAMFNITDINRMSSTLVETVQINYEDFNDRSVTTFISSRNVRLVALTVRQLLRDIIRKRFKLNML